MKLEKIIDSNEIKKRVKKLAEEIENFYGGDNFIVIGILRGAFIFAADLVREFKESVRVDFISARSYMGDRSSGKVEIKLEPSLNINNVDVLLVEDIVDTGLTAEYIKEYLLKRGARSVKLCTFLDRKLEGKEIIPDFVGFVVEDSRFLVGYGLDLNEQGRTLPSIFAVESED